MFTRPTVFILGAGISAPFGFPVGRQMKDAICNGQYKSVRGNVIRTLYDTVMAEVAAKTMGDGYGRGPASRFLDAFRASDLYSIDAWLEANQSDIHLLRAGKAAIALVILHAESIAKENGADVEDDWFGWLWNNLWTPAIEDIEKNQVWFVTFNYDRLLEWKLDRQIRNTYLRYDSKQHDRALAFLQKRIVHVHGVLGSSISQNYADAFGAESLNNIPDALKDDLGNPNHPYSNRLSEIAKGINVVSETVDDEKLVDRAISFLKKERARLVFLGFSYDKRNLIKLGLDEYSKTIDFFHNRDLDRRLDDNRIIGTAMGLKRGELTNIEAKFNGNIALDNRGMDAVEFCRSYIRGI